MAEERGQGITFFQWINVILSFLFMVIGLPVLLYLAAAALGWQRLVYWSPLYWGILAISLVLGFSNASHYYKRLQSKLRE